MAKLAKQYYYKANGGKEIHCYKVNIAKALVNKAGLQDKEITIKVEDHKIIIELAKQGKGE